ncbi:hypothetical protein NE237_016304 [Protea cynaroides]|uniref:Uncharacterized protein n=1 Tax=Protea cynaroides TaxID=273540 RepID=A0A9Q0GP16_9MAGN|nr:hypothetical protein NE237_016304 [Protea cynaroides]
MEERLPGLPRHPGRSDISEALPPGSDSSSAPAPPSVIGSLNLGCESFPPLNPQSGSIPGPGGLPIEGQWNEPLQAKPKPLRKLILRPGTRAAATGPSFFGCLAAEPDPASPGRPSMPAVPLPPAVSDLSPPLAVGKSKPIPLPGPKSPSSSAGHTPFPPRRSGAPSVSGSSSNSPNPCPVVKPPFISDSPTGLVEPSSSPLGPIGPPSFSACPGPKKSLFQHARAAVRPGQWSLLGQVATAANFSKGGQNLGEMLEKDRVDKRGKTKWMF